jgi:hypothetical protein
VAWVLFAFSVVLAVFELWVNSTAIGTFNFFGLVDGPEEIATFVLLIYGVWLLVGVVFLFVLKGRRNRIVGLANDVRRLSRRLVATDPIITE